MDDEARDVEVAIVRLSQRLGIIVGADDDVRVIAASFAHDMISDWSTHVPTIDDLADRFAEWVEG